MKRSPAIVRSELAVFPWDSEELVDLGASALAEILQRYLAGYVSPVDLTEWADAIEGREDIGFRSPKGRMIKEIIYEIANPDLELPVFRDRAGIWLDQLKDSAGERA